jgi:hypothetical protein
MNNKNPYAKLDHTIKFMRVQDLEVRLKHAEEDFDQKFAEFIENTQVVAQELDLFMREKYKDDPKKLAEWNEVMEMYVFIDDDEDEDESPSTTKE